jgi:2-polyprenyl-3-methyl-5-hydroxy-6-metoxy-1,4-benzoquinol methylase
LGEMSSRGLTGAVAYHNELAETWEDRYKTDRFSVRLRMISKMLPERQEGKRWLDAGCGTGTIARWLAKERGASVVAVDASEAMLANAAKSSGVQYILSDVTCSGLLDGSFDGIVCSSVLEYLPDPAIALKEFRRVIRPGGTVLASVPNAALSVRIPLWLAYWTTRPMGRRRFFPYLDHSQHSFTEQQIGRLLCANGFSLKITEAFGKIHLPFGFDLPSAGTLLMVRCMLTSV